jgi:hypothetical protein
MQERSSLRLVLVTLTGEPIRQVVEIKLRNRLIAGERVIKAVADKPIVIPDLEAKGFYEIEVETPRFEPQRRLIEIEAGAAELVIVFPPRESGECDRPPACPPPKIPDHLDEPALTSQVAVRLAGTPRRRLRRSRAESAKSDLGGERR